MTVALHEQGLFSWSEWSRALARQIQTAKDGSVWAMTITGAVVRIDADSFATTVYANYRGRPFRAIYASPSGEIWATSREHLVRFDASHAEKEPTDVPVAVAGALMPYLLRARPTLNPRAP